MIREITLPTIIAEASEIQGDLVFKASATVQGIVEGNLYHQSHEPLRIAAKAWIQGNIHSEGPVIIEGKVEGTIQSTCSIELTPKATVFGLLSAPKLIVSSGASLEADCKMSTQCNNTSLRLAA